jgi:hypothetical protein
MYRKLFLLNIILGKKLTLCILLPDFRTDIKINTEDSILKIFL